MSRIGASVQTIATKLADEALRDGVSASELKSFVAKGTEGMSADEVKAVHSSFAQQLERFGDDYFNSVFGVSKTDLLDALQDRAAPSCGGNAALQFHNLQADAGKRKEVIGEVERFMFSPMPGEGPAQLKAILNKDASLAKAGDTDALAARLMDFNASLPPAAVINSFAKTGATGPSDNTLSTVARKLIEESMDPVGDVAGALQQDKWVTSMLKETGHSATDLSRYMMMPSRHEVGTLIDNFLSGSGKQKAENAHGMLKEMSGGQDIMPIRDLPAADKLDYDDAIHILSHVVNDYSLSENAGRYTISARYFGDTVNDAQVMAALDKIAGSYGTEFAVNKG